MEKEKVFGLELEIIYNDGSVDCFSELFLTLVDLIETLVSYLSRNDVQSHSYNIYECELLISFN